MRFHDFHAQRGSLIAIFDSIIGSPRCSPFQQPKRRVRNWASPRGPGRPPGVVSPMGLNSESAVELQSEPAGVETSSGLPAVIAVQWCSLSLVANNKQVGGPRCAGWRPCRAQQEQQAGQAEPAQQQAPLPEPPQLEGAARPAAPQRPKMQNEATALQSGDWCALGLLNLSASEAAGPLPNEKPEQPLASSPGQLLKSCSCRACCRVGTSLTKRFGLVGGLAWFGLLVSKGTALQYSFAVACRWRKQFGWRHLLVKRSCS